VTFYENPVFLASIEGEGVSDKRGPATRDSYFYAVPPLTKPSRRGLAEDGQ
jgi:hypothetical protein